VLTKRIIRSRASIVPTRSGSAPSERAGGGEPAPSRTKVKPIPMVPIKVRQTRAAQRELREKIRAAQTTLGNSGTGTRARRGSRRREAANKSALPAVARKGGRSARGRPPPSSQNVTSSSDKSAPSSGPGESREDTGTASPTLTPEVESEERSVSPPPPAPTKSKKAKKAPSPALANPFGVLEIEMDEEAEGDATGTEKTSGTPKQPPTANTTPTASPSKKEPSPETVLEQSAPQDQTIRPRGNREIWKFADGSTSPSTMGAFWQTLNEADRCELAQVNKKTILDLLASTRTKPICNCHICLRHRGIVQDEIAELYDMFYWDILESQENCDSKQLECRCQRDDSMSIRDAYSHDRQLATQNLPFLVRATDAVLATSSGALGRECMERGAAFLDTMERVADCKLRDHAQQCPELMQRLEKCAQSRHCRYRAPTAVENFDQGPYPNDAPGWPQTDSPTNSCLPPAGPCTPPKKDSSEIQEDAAAEYDLPPSTMAMCPCPRLNEGRYMFELFASRLFHQRVQKAFLERVADLKQQQLLEEEEEHKFSDKVRRERRRKKRQEKRRKKREKRKP